MANITKDVAKIENKGFAHLFLSELLNVGKIKFIGVGIFSLKRMPARKGFNPATKQYEYFPSYVKVVFTPDYNFKEQIQLWQPKK